MKLKKRFLVFIAVVFYQLILSSCGSVRKTTYFVDQNDASIILKNNAPENVIHPTDILSITVSSLNPTATAIFNTPNFSYVTSSSSNGTSLQSPGYLVNATGFIQFPVVGNIKVSGLTTEQFRLQLAKVLVDKQLLVDPIIMVRQLNFKISVLGEVAHPTVITVPNESISLLEALGLAGDITIYGRKDNVMIIREEDGVKKIKRLNLNNNELFTSPYYYLKSNDVVYVEANKAKVTSSGSAVQILPIIFGALSFGVIVIDRLTR